MEIDMSVENKILIAGFGGQGVLFAGKFLVYTGMHQDKEITWLPSYGPEMRGGTANCSVIISDTPVGSPIVSKPNVLVVMNLPSFDKYEKDTLPGGKIFIDSSLIEKKTQRSDVDAYYIPATQLSYDHDLGSLANMIMMGKVLRETGLSNLEQAEQTMKSVVPESKKHLFDANLKALSIGYQYKD